MKKILLYGLFLMMALTGMAQDGSRLQALKIAYLTKKLDLSPEEAQRFWPIYNHYSDEILVVKITAIKNNWTEIQEEEDILNIRKKYIPQFNRALSPEKTNTLFRSEKEFGNFVQKEMERRQLRQQQQQRRSMIRP
jgi:hypothetical protein